jgi:hypothetical protein
MRKSGVFVFFIVFLLAGAIFLEPVFQPVKAQQSTGSFSDDFSTDSGSWQYLGRAYRDNTNKYLVLTNAEYFTGGVTFFKTPIQGSFTANFRYKVGGGSNQGDGFTLFFYKQKYSSVDTGGSLGFISKENSVRHIVPGYGIEFDAWQNWVSDFQQISGGKQNPQGDPSANHIGLIEGFSGNHLAYVDDLRVADNNWHKVSISVQGSSVSVYVDQGLVLQWSGALNRTFDGFGFSAGTGGPGSNMHIIDDFSISASAIHTPSLTTSCISPQSQSGFNVFKINGQLTFDGAGISGAPIYLSYSVTGGDSWQDLTLLNTHSDGSYSALWLPTVTGNYLLKAVYKGNDNYLGTNNIVNFAIEPFAEQSVFSVTSNSTITELSFHSTSKELSFRVFGDSGTMGYVNVYIPKSLVNDTADFKVYLDGNQVDYTVQSQSDCWLLYFAYHHSNHLVTISLGESFVNPSPVSIISPNQTQISRLDWVNIAILAFLGTTVIIVVIAAVRVLQKKTLSTPKNR